MKEFSDVPVWRRLLPLGFVFALAMTLTGCPYGSDLDNLEEHVAAGEGCEVNAGNYVLNRVQRLVPQGRQQRLDQGG